MTTCQTERARLLDVLRRIGCQRLDAMSVGEVMRVLWPYSVTRSTDGSVSHEWRCEYPEDV